MINVKTYFLYTITGLLLIALSAGQAFSAAATPPPTDGTTATTSKPSIPTAKETESSTVEDGGTGPYKAVMVSDSSITTHTIFRPKDLSAFSEKNKLPIFAWGNGGCANSNAANQNYLSEIASHGFLVIAIGPYQPAGQRGRGGDARGGMPGGAAGAGRGGEAGDAMRGAADRGGMGGRGAGAPGAVPAAGARGDANAVGRGAAGGRGGAGGGMGSGTQSSQLLDAINWAIAQNNDKASIYYNKINISKVGVAGHSCGGLQALEVSSDPRITTTIVVDSGILNANDPGPGGGRGAGDRGARGGPESANTRGGAPAETRGAPADGARGGAGGGGMGGMPALTKDYLAKLHGPVFYLLGGESDMAYANGTDDFKRIEKLPVFMANQDVGHGGTFGQPRGGDWATVSAAWLKWQLRGDTEAGKLFTGNPCGLAQDKKWTVEKKNIL
jgi:hypothetical protein